MSENPKPFRVFAPGDTIVDELAARGWTQSRLSEIMGRPLQLVNAICRGRRAITPGTALELGAAFGTSAQFWLNLETRYRLWLAEQRTSDLEAIRLRAKAG
ncbi:MAG: HigA family addiction module antidote protein [Fimbriimonas ginsengisoli]|uniref:HigA family addiction module antidote protein n=1 Tax=Fimbriimonas ginsengisoli TaxID=1005039 RepID=A0A931LUH9_FIMGI|nr:HigA family addiction module antidote protein [Fimbriimonas ginsengisoli]